MSNPPHSMELPRKILIGEGVISHLGSFIIDLNKNVNRVSLISGNVVKSRSGDSCSKILRECSIVDSWHTAPIATIEAVTALQDEIRATSPDFLIGIGGGRSVDIAKMISFSLKVPFISVPTSASHDGISSPFVSIRGHDKPYSLKAHAPIGVLADTGLISKAPGRLNASGCGDLIGKLTAVKDWELARDDTNEYFGTYAANLAHLSSRIITDMYKVSTRSEKDIRTIVEALISAGVASCIAGSSRPCSGSEHLFSHALEYVSSDNCGLHGERVGLGTIMMSQLHGLETESVIKALKNAGAPTTARELKIKEKEIIRALLIAQSLRPDRYTILSKIKLDTDSATKLARSVNVI
jgi:glycerol-1-phosphate dehydrogenase [NAD(P)+]